MLETKKEIVWQDIKQHACDACLIESDFSRYWYTDFFSSAGYLIITKQKDYLLIDRRYFEAAKKMIQNVEVLPFERLSDLKALFTKIKVKKLLVEEEYITLETLKLLWDMQLETIGTNSRNWRIIKDEKAIQALKASAAIAAKTIEWIKTQKIIGKTEKEVATMITVHMIEMGADGNSFDPIVATGLNGAIPHHHPDDTILEEGNLVTLDIGCMYKHYASDITRTFALGQKLNNPLLEKLYYTVLEANLKGINAAKPNIKGSTVDKVCRDYIAQFPEFKDYFTHATGHGVGLEVHELPYVSLRSNNPLPVNSCFTVEPGIYIPGLGGARVEDTNIMTPDGAVVITDFAKKDLYLK